MALCKREPSTGQYHIMFPKDSPWRDKNYLAWVKTLPCAHCKAPADDAHHIKITGVGGRGLTAPDFAAMPLCRRCHDDVHKEPTFYPQTRWMIETQSRAHAEGILS